MQKSIWLKPFAITGIALLAFAGLAGCQGKSDHASSAAKTPLGNEAAKHPAMNTADTSATVTSGKIIATINGQPLYEENLKVIQGALPKAMPEQHLVERMIELRLLASAAREEGLDKQIKTKAQIQNAVDNQLANDYLSNYLSKMDVSDAVLKPEYDKFIKGYPSTTQYKAAHILVKTKEEAEAIIKQLDSGTPFDQLAKDKSQDPGSAKQGGELGWFDADQMVPEFSAAVEKLKKGEITQQPVKSQFGWHVIKLEDTRLSQPPTFSELKPQLETQYRRTAIEDLIKKLRSKAKIDIMSIPTTPEAKPAEAPKPAAEPAPATKP
jgi:peptidyl-prolyl cis-trans isomerase C